MEPKICGLKEYELRTISFSSLTDFKLCPYYYKLAHLNKLRPFTNNTWTIYGKLLHVAVQNVLMGKSDCESAVRSLDRTWTKFCGIYKKNILKDIKDDVNPVDFKIPAFIVINTIKESFLKEFGPFEALEAEEWLRQKAHPDHVQDFVGCVDLVIKQLDTGKIFIVDFKSCSSSFMFNKFMDSWKSYQLTLYKHFYSQKHKMDPKNIETYFVTMERNYKSKKPLGFVRVTSGPKKVENALNWLYDTLGSINARCYIKNKMACHKFGEGHPCMFFHTDFCK